MRFVRRRSVYWDGHVVCTCARGAMYRDLSVVTRATQTSSSICVITW